MSIKVSSQVVATFDLEDIPPKDVGDVIRLRLEVAKIYNGVSPSLKLTIWRKETYRIEPTFKLDNTEIVHHSDEIVLIYDDFLSRLVSNLQCAEVDELLSSAVLMIETALADARP